ncbi:cell division protein FtsB [Thiorhodovibrio frisius]|uniref:Cell division protein FtsB n=1 Tax=Thiorhodovibrio frisius TaxID=631362 RepID=H8Z3C9_9GAMM|nr:cell division protein FtsB [Thiorhodovibrio frisius]EIC21837.1 septum formation initiator [Thiorhodovibrio frisius]WPL21805.1 Cell division protein FtsB [Thiorhodovibrio frisius]
MTSIRWLVLVLLALFGLLQYRLWVGEGSLAQLHTLKGQIGEQQVELDRLRARNQALIAEVESLKTGLAAIEERARFDLGMIQDGELFLQIIEKSAAERARRRAEPAGEH